MGLRHANAHIRCDTLRSTYVNTYVKQTSCGKQWMSGRKYFKVGVFEFECYFWTD